MRKSEKKGPNPKSPCCPIFNFFVVTREVICQKMAPILDLVIFFGFSAFKAAVPEKSDRGPVWIAVQQVGEGQEVRYHIGQRRPHVEEDEVAQSVYSKR